MWSCSGWNYFSLALKISRSAPNLLHNSSKRLGYAIIHLCLHFVYKVSSAQMCRAKGIAHKLANLVFWKCFSSVNFHPRESNGVRAGTRLVCRLGAESFTAGALTVNLWVLLKPGAAGLRYWPGPIVADCSYKVLVVCSSLIRRSRPLDYFPFKDTRSINHSRQLGWASAIVQPFESLDSRLGLSRNHC